MNPEAARLWDLNRAIEQRGQVHAEQRAKAAAEANPPRLPKPPLTPEQAFVKSNTAGRQEVYAATLAAGADHAAAAAAAGYAPRTARSGVLMANPHVAAKVADLTKQKLEAAGITAQRVMQEIGRIAFLDIRKLYDANGNLKPIHELDDDSAAALSSVDVETKWEGKGDAAVPVTTKKIRTVDKMAGLNLLAKHFKLVGDEGDGVNAFASALADRLRSARRRADPAEEVEDAVIVEPDQVAYDPEPEPLQPDPQPEQEYRYEDDPLG